MHSSVSVVEDSNLGIVVLSMAYEMFVRVLFVDIYLFMVDNRFLESDEYVCVKDEILGNVVL